MQLLLFLFCFAFLFVLIWFVRRTLRRSEEAIPRLVWHHQERHFVDPQTNEEMEFGSINKEPPSVYFTLVVPAYNEEYRIQPMLDEALDHLEKRRQLDPNFTYEIIVVDDCSTDGTKRVVLDCVSRVGVDKLRLLPLAQNRGKGGAIRRGVLSSRGRYILFADADGASLFSDFDKLELQLKKHEQRETGVAIGCRRHTEPEASVKKSVFRKILTWGFATLRSLVGVRGIRDTQCGFKLFTRKSARVLFGLMHIERFAFDVELLILAQTLEMPIVEVPISWQEIAGSKVDPIWDSVKMARDLLKIRLFYLFQVWSDDPSALPPSLEDPEQS